MATDSEDQALFPALFKHLNSTIAAWGKLKALFEQQAELWVALRALEATQPHLNPAVGARIDDLEEEAESSAEAAQEELIVFGNVLEDPPVPRDNAGKRRLPIQWVHSLRHVRERRFKIGRDAAVGSVGLQAPGGGGGGTWVLADEMGGGMSIGTLWLQFDAQNVIIDASQERVFRKNTHFSRDLWREPAMWEGDVRDPDNKTPYEMTCHDALQDVFRLSTVVPLRERIHRGLINNNNQSYRIYLPWCPNGDLGTIGKRHIDNHARIPEAMVWYVAECLVEAGIAMQDGSLDVKYPNWVEIIHRDLKPENVFLGAPDPRRYPTYPKPLLGDFGLAFKSPDIDLNNPDWYNDRVGTPGLLAPEQLRFVDTDDLTPVDDFALSAWTNVYGLGLILWMLITNWGGPPHYNGPDQREWLGTGDQHDPLAFPIGTPALAYSQALRDMIMNCLQYDVLRRPTFKDLQRTIRHETDERPGRPNRTFFMRSGVAPAHVKAAQRILLAQDKYRVGLHRNQLV